jgi:predicted dehydrogenase
VIAARRHLLCQKPLAEDFGEAQELVGLAEEAGVILAVNQNSRWTAGIRHARHLIEEGWIGQPLIGPIECDTFIDWSNWGWLEQVPRLVLLYNTIHSIESMRSIFGMPHSVFALLGRDPEQRAIGETVALLTFRFDSGLLFLVKENARNRSADQHARFRFEGTSGVIDGTLGIYSVPAFGTPDTLRLTTAGADFSFDAQFREAWMPDAFIGTMGELLAAITEQREPEHGGRGNLDLLRLVFAAYRSAEAERPVAPQEIG